MTNQHKNLIALLVVTVVGGLCLWMIGATFNKLDETIKNIPIQHWELSIDIPITSMDDVHTFKADFARETNCWQHGSLISETLGAVSFECKRLQVN